MVWGKSLGPRFSFSIQEVLPDLHKLFFFSFSFLVFLCFHHPAIIVHEVVLCLFLCFVCFQEFVETVFPPFFRSPYQSLGSDAVVKSRMPVENSPGPFFQVGKQFFLPFATSVFCEIQSSMVSCVFAYVLQPLWCFF